MEKSNEKSVYELLAMTASDSSSSTDAAQILYRAEQQTIPPRRKKRKRRLKRSQRTLNHTCDEDEDLILPSIFKSKKYCFCLNRTLLCCIIVVIVISWLTSLTFLLLSFHTQVNQLHSNIDNVVAGSQGVPDALQKCHSLSKQLEHNQTDLLNKFNSISTQIKNFSIQISDLHLTISKLEEKLNASPQVIDVPARLSELSKNVALFGSTINDLTNTVNNVKNQCDQSSQILNKNVTNLKESIDTLNKSQLVPPVTTNIDDKLNAKVDELRLNLTKINETLETKLDWVKKDQQKDHTTIEDLQGYNATMSTRISSMQVDVNKITSSVNLLIDNVIKLNSSLHGGSTTTTPVSPLDFNFFKSTAQKLPQSTDRTVEEKPNSEIPT